MVCANKHYEVFGEKVSHGMVSKSKILRVLLKILETHFWSVHMLLLMTWISIYQIYFVSLVFFSINYFTEDSPILPARSLPRYFIIKIKFFTSSHSWQFGPLLPLFFFTEHPTTSRSASLSILARTNFFLGHLGSDFSTCLIAFPVVIVLFEMVNWLIIMSKMKLLVLS